MQGTNRIIATLLYGSGMRLLECMRLRVKDIDFERREILIREGKGVRDRVTMLPEAVRAEADAEGVRPLRSCVTDLVHLHPS